MYGFDPTDEQKMLVDTVQKFATKELRESAHDADEEGGYAPDVIRHGWELGILQASIPEAYGGFGERSAVTGVLAAEELAWGDLVGALAVMAPASFAIPILLAGSEAQKTRWLPGLAEGDWQPLVGAVTEPRFDFYVGDLETVAVRANGGYRLSGEKSMVPFADTAKAFLVFARVDDRPQAFILPRQTTGVEVGDRERYLGLGALPMFRVRLNEVEVSAEDRLGGPEGFAVEPILASAQAASAALAVGLGRAAYEYARDYAKEREAFGVPIAQKQTIAFMLAEMATEVEAARLMAWESAWMLDAGQDAFRESVLALTCATDMAMTVTDRAVQVLGGHGYIREHPVERWMRNGRGVPLLPGLAMV